MKEDFEKAKTLIYQSTNILLTMHEGMDGDDGGSVLAMLWQLEKLGKKVTCAIKKGVPPNLQFLPGSEHIKDDVDTTSFDLLITFGCATLERTGSSKILNLNPSRLARAEAESAILNIDHHPDNTHFGQVNLVDKEKSSVAELVYDFFIYSAWPISPEVATCLLTGIVTDTGSFRHSNTKASTLKAAAELMSKGALVDKIIGHTARTKNPKTLRAWGKAMENSYYDEKQKVLYSILTKADLDEIGNLPAAAFEGFVETLNAVPEAKFAMFIRQDGENIKGSLRSDSFKQVNVAEIAKMFGGGGHTQAAGFSVVGKLTKDESGGWHVM